MCNLPKTARLLIGMALSLQAQWLNHPSPGTPRTKDGKANLAAKAPRAANGKPDLSGVWRVEPTPVDIDRMLGTFGDYAALIVPGDDPRTFSKYFLNILADFKPEDAPLRPAAAQLLRQHGARMGIDNPDNRCAPMGVPRADLIGFPFKIIQTPDVTVMMYEADSSHRQVYTDGRRLPIDPQPSWLGYSVGRWEDGTLIVDTVGFNDQGWLDALGTPRSEALRVQERFHRRDFGHMDVQVTVEDPVIFTTPVNLKFTELLLPDTDILESFCNENEKDRQHLIVPGPSGTTK
jgi:hypothetical protein